jgi:hypothetical protein
VSLLFDALGHWAIGHTPDGAQTFTLSADAGAFSIAGVAATFTIKEAPAAGAFSIGAIAGSFTVKTALEGAGAFAWAGKAASFTVKESAVAGAFTINGQPANEIILEADAAGAFVISTFPAVLDRSGYDFEPALGGVGHFLLEAAEARRLAAITKRNIPPAIDTRTTPQFGPLARPQSAPLAPVVDIAAIAAQRATAEMQAAQAAKKRRRDVEAILLLAS